MKKIDYYIKQYLENRPMFLSIIRSQEAMLFQKYRYLLKSPILDFGCGDGFFTQTVFGKKNIDIGLDLVNNQRIKEAKKEKIYKKIILYDGKKIPFPDNYFNSIFANCVLEHIVNVKLSLKEIYRILKPNGLFLASVMTNQWENYLFGFKLFGKIYLQYMRKLQNHYNLLSNEKWQKFFKNVGFKIQSIDGYLYKRSAFYLELLHYLSIGSILNYVLFNKWVLFSIPVLNRIKTQWIKKIIINENNSSKAAALFFVLKK